MFLYSYIYVLIYIPIYVHFKGALKIKEMCYLHAEGFSGGALKHGPFALIQVGAYEYECEFMHACLHACIYVSVCINTYIRIFRYINIHICM